MGSKKKLQVFISSTYEDLQNERQVAVQAILNSGHIPAGMELFASGDKSQLEVIKQWIKESDVYLLILAGRYGTIDKTSHKSYIQLEYEYALKIGKPHFAVVISEHALDEKVKLNGKKVLELDNPTKYKDFKSLVLSKVVRYWEDPKDIKIAIHETLAEMEKRDDLIGWIPGNHKINNDKVTVLEKENSSLRKRIKELETEDLFISTINYNSIINNLKLHIIDIDIYEKSDRNNLKKIASSFGDTEFNLLHFFWMIKNDIFESAMIDKRPQDIGSKLLRESSFYLRDYGLIEIHYYSDTHDSLEFTDLGKNFVREFSNKNSSKLKEILKAIADYYKVTL
jgi:hypothetical protein